MPHRVADFFRSSNENITTIKKTVQRRPSPAARPQLPPRAGSFASFIEGSVTDDHHAKMPEGNKESHRLSLFTNLLPGHKAAKEPAHTDASLDWKIESPPVIFQGTREESSGALLSGQMLLDVKEEPFELELFGAKLEMVVTHKKPFNSHCHDCATQRTELKKWSFLSEATPLTKRQHEFPFSVLLEGHLPSTTDSHILSIKYEFTATAKRRHSSSGTPALKLVRNISIGRALPVPETPHHSLRIFPPTDITANMHYDAVVHPMGVHRLSLRLEGIGKHNESVKSVEYWKLKRLSWKLEEQVNAVAPACAKHAPKVSRPASPAIGSTSTSTPEDVHSTPTAAATTPTTETATSSTSLSPAAKKDRSDIRVLASADLHSGWKADYMSENGNVEAEIEYQIPGITSPASSYSTHSSASIHNHRPVSCDLTTRDGSISISHRLVVEMVVAQEYAPVANAKQVTPTGIARILRMNFAIVVTEHAGQGISWDNEAPPIYQDVPPSPPSYANAVVVHGSVEDFALSPLVAPAAAPAGEASPPYSEEPIPRGASPTGL
ncbi:hypothetical protein F5Y16DRAFT_413295 [Xylariaceae sp. FL0255]|nr:hypothetical protein F5Y16DRAFT_413295 [Xylariaceae sp. FL0255]